MRTGRNHLWIWAPKHNIWVLGMCLCLGVTCPALATAARPQQLDRQQTEVLFLSFVDPDLPDITSLIEEAQTQIVEGRDTPVHFTLESLYPSILEKEPSHQDKALLLLKEKYRGKTFDLVITIGERPGLFEKLSRAKLFPGAGHLFFAVNPKDTLRRPKSKLEATGVVRTLNYLPTLQLALRQNPGTRRIVVIFGSSGIEKLEAAVARDEFQSYESSVDFEYWTDLKFEDLRSRLTSVSGNAVVLFLDFMEDSEGEQFTPARVLRTVANTANRPVYGAFMSFVGNGVVGGHVADLQEVGRILGRNAARVLNGEKPGDIPVETGEFQRDVFDWRQLHRWDISTDQLPPGSSILYWEASPWEFYRWKILGLLALVLFEALLIILLLQSRRHRTLAQQALRQKEGELLEAHRLAQLGSWTWRPSSDAVAYSVELCDLFGLELSHEIPSFQQLSRLFTRNSWERMTQYAERARAGEAFELELEGVRLDGTRIWLTVRGEPVCAPDGHLVLVRGTMQNITERKKAEEARLKHSAIVESSDDAIISKDLNGIIVSWNAAAERMYGFSEAEAVGKSIMILIPSELRDEEDIILRRVREGERIEHYETVRISKAGERVNVSLTILPVRDSTGQVVGSSEIARDITQRRQAEEQLRKSEEKFSKAFREGPMAIALTSAETYRYIDVNETFERFTGYRRDELIGRTGIEVGIWADPNEGMGLTKQLLSEGHLRDVEFRFRTKDGHLRIALASAELIEIEGKPCILGVAEDITDRKRAEQALLESEKRFRLMSDSAPVMMWLSGPDKLCTDFNQGWLTFTGRTLQQELGEGWAQGVHPDDLQACLDAYGHAFDARQSFAIEYRLRRHDGPYRWVLDRGVPRFLENGEFAGYIGGCVDITEEKEAKAARRDFSSRLIHAQEEERARIARELHDDINQRLALLANGLQELARDSGTPSKSERKELQELWQLTSEIANDIQHLSHELHPSKLHYLGLGAAVRDLCQDFSKQHKFEVECIVRDLPRNLDEGVSLSLFRTIQESLRNVAKHSQAHHVKVELTHQSNVIRLSVSDDGVGFDPDQVGTNHGLGLVSMQEHLTSAGGVLSVWSRPSLGTQIEGTVPAVASARSA